LICAPGSVQSLGWSDGRFWNLLSVVPVEEASLPGYTNDFIAVSWYPAGFYILEQGEAPVNLYLILSGVVEARRELPDGAQESVNSLAKRVWRSASRATPM